MHVTALRCRKDFYSARYISSSRRSCVLLACQHCPSYSARGSRVLHACGKVYSLLSCFYGSAQLSLLAFYRHWPALRMPAGPALLAAMRVCRTHAIRHWPEQYRVWGWGVTRSLARLHNSGLCCCSHPFVVRGLRRGDTFKAYGTTKMWEIMVSMELNDRCACNSGSSLAALTEWHCMLH
jgi:hypothetical protein